MSRLVALGTFLVLLAAPVVSPAADKPATTDGPIVVVRLQSITQLLENAEYLIDLAGAKDDIGPIFAAVKAAASTKSLDGVDTRKRFLIYGLTTGKVADSTGVVMVPIADKTAFLSMLKDRFNLIVKEEKEGFYSTSIPNTPSPTYFRFANDYLYIYVSMVKPAFVDEKDLPKPEDIIGKDDGVASIGFRIDRLPEEMRKFALVTVETMLAEAKNKPVPNETEKLKAVKDKAVDSLVGAVKAILFEGQELTLKLDIKPKKDELALAIDLTAKAGTDLAKDLADLKSKKSVGFGSLATQKAAMMLAMNLSLPESVKKVLGPAIDEALKGALDMAPGEYQEALDPLVKSIVPSLKAADFDGGFAITGPDANNTYTVVVGGRVTAGNGIDTALKDLMKKLPEPVPSFFEFDADTIGKFKIHSVKIRDQIPDDVKKIFGETDVWIAFRDDAFFMAFGPDAKKALKDALSNPAAAGSLFKVQISFSRFVALVEATNAEANAKDIKGIFAGKSDKVDDSIAFSIEGGDGFQMRLSVKGKVIKYVVALDKAKKAKKDK